MCLEVRRRNCVYLRVFVSGWLRCCAQAAVASSLRQSFADVAERSRFSESDTASAGEQQSGFAWGDDGLSVGPI
jgi:hypothetical protein